MRDFTAAQKRALSSVLDPAHVQVREHEGKSLSYIEGWFAIAEANAIFGFAGWDREMVYLERLFERSRVGGIACAYAARVRITVRAGEGRVAREGTGFGHALRPLAADAHEQALKAAETDATKRALATFGNRFGLALYNKGQTGVTHDTVRRLDLIAADGTVVAASLSAEAYATGLRQLIEGETSPEALERLRCANREALVQLREQFPGLKTARNRHYADILEGLFDTVAQRLKQARQHNGADVVDEVAGAGAAASAGEQAAAGSTNVPAVLSPNPSNGGGAGEQPASASAVADNEDATASRDVPAVPPNAPNDSSSLAEQPAPQLLALKAADPLLLLPRPSRLSFAPAIDKSALLISQTRRVRNKAHLDLVGAKPCLICEETPCHAHHLTFAQPRGLSVKVSDEYTVPLCAFHHNELHGRLRDERSFWRRHGIDPLPIALSLWHQTLSVLIQGGRQL
jgi:Rad52/22 family double-strand break repair protein